MSTMAVTLSQLATERQKPTKGSKFANRKSFDAWLGSLPLANVNAACDGLLSALQESNNIRIANRFRLSVLEAISEPIGAVVTVLDKQYQDTTFPLTEKKDKFGRLAIQFYRELASGYRLTADQISKQKPRVPLGRRRSAALCVHRALAALEQMLRRACLMYQPLAPLVWNEIHTLYAFARQNGFHQRILKNAFGWSKKESSIEDVYKRIALLGICDPSRLDQRSIKRISRAMELWATRCSVQEGSARASGQADKFEILVDAGYPPRLVVDEQANVKRDLIFDLRALKAWLKEIVEQSDDVRGEISLNVDGHEALILDAMLLRQLVKTWGVRLERSYERLPATHEVSLILGINGIHFTLGGELSFRQFLDRLGDPGLLKSSAAAKRPRSSEQHFRPPVHKAQVLNQSLGGYCLRLQDVANMSLKVGELVSVCAASIEGQDVVWVLGVVRWLHAIGIDELEIGVSLIGQSVRAAGTVSRDPRCNLPPCLALAMSDFGPHRTHTSYLVVPPTFSALQGVVRIGTCHEKEVVGGEFRLTGVIEKTTEFCCFSYEDRVPIYEHTGLPDETHPAVLSQTQLRA